MNLKTSFFNKSIIKSDFKRFWWVGALETLGIFLLFTFVYLNDVMDGYDKVSEIFGTSGIYRNGSVAMPLVCIFPVALAALLFAYLNSSGSVSCLHGLPVKRRTFFASHMFSGMTLLTVPILINVIILLLFRIDKTVAESFKCSYLFIWAGLYILYTLLAFNASSAVAMLTGNSVASIVFTYIFACLPMLAEAFIKFFCEQQLYGYSAASESVITNFLYNSPLQLYENPWNVVKYIIFALVFLAAAYYLYKIRKLENNGEVVAFPKLRPIFVYGVAICAGAAGYAYFNSIWNIGSVLLLIPFGVIGIIVAEMIVRKSLKVKTAFKPAIVFCLAVCVLQLGFQLDIFGYEKRVPAVESIESIAFDNEVNNHFYRYTSNGKRIYYDENENLLKTPEDIDSVVRLHEELIENRTYEDNGNGSGMYFTLTYNLKNGKKMTRNYHADYVKHREFLKPIIESPQMRKVYFPILSDTAKTLVSAAVEDRRINGDIITYFEDSKPEMERLINALKADAANTAYDEFAARREELTDIHIVYKKPAKYADGSAVPDELLPVINETYYIRSDYKNVIALLTELGFYDKLPKAEDIEAVGIDYYGSEMAEAEIIYDTRSYDIDGKNRNFAKLIKDREEIKTVYEYVSENKIARHSNGDMEFILKDGYSFSVPFDLDAEGIPAVVKP